MILRPGMVLLMAMGSASAFAKSTETDYLSSRIGAAYKAPLSKKDMSKGDPKAEKKMIQCYRDEMAVSEVINTALKNVRQGIVDKTANDMFATLPNANVFPSLPAKAATTVDGIAIRKPTTASASFKDYTTGFNITDASFDVIDEMMPMDTRAENMDVKQMSLLSRYDFRGTDAKNQKRQDRGTVEMQFQKMDKAWKLTGMTFKTMESLHSNKVPLFRKVASADMPVPVKLRSEAIRRGGYALSNADINNDGMMDLLVANRDGLQLFTGQKGGGYKQMMNTGLENVAYVKTAVFADLNNAGHKDLILTRLENIVPDHKTPKHPASVFVYKGDGTGKFTLVPKAINSDKKKYLESMPATVADFNSDGLLDVYVGYPGIKDFTADSGVAMEKEFTPQGVYLNKGNYTFEDFTDKFTTADFKGGKLFPHASLAANFDHKNGVDLLIADDRGNLSPVFVSTGKGFKESAEAIGVGNRGYGMSIAVGDANNDGMTDMIFTNVNMASAERFNKTCARNFNLPRAGNGGEKGMRLFHGSADGKFQEVAAAGMDDVGFGDAGVTFVDYNHDGYQDIYLVNGLWSGTRTGDEQDSLFTLATEMKSEGLIHPLKEEANGGYKDFLYKSHGNFDYVSNKWMSKEGVRPSLAGFQRNRLFRNNGNGSYTEVGYFEGVDSIADGYVVGKSDVNHDGIEDLVLRNSDPGTNEYSYEPVEVYINQAKDNAVKRKITLRFEGVESTRDAFGTFVVLNKSNGKKEVHHLIANSGAVQDEPAIRIYLGKNEKVNSMAVHWTSGKVQNMNKIAPGNYMIKEGKSMRSLSSL